MAEGPRLLPLGGALLLSFTFGAIHAFGVLLRPLEQALAASRIEVSLGYSVALVALTAGVLAAPRLSGRYGSGRVALYSGLAGTAGLTVAAYGGSVGLFILGFGLLFGFSNGIVYVLFLDQAAGALPANPGLGQGGATAAYGLGAATFSPALGAIADHWSAGAALLLLAASILASSIVAGLVFARTDVADQKQETATGASRHSGLLRLWCIYFFAVSGSLMIVAHGDAIVRTAGASAVTAHLAPSLFALGNILGSLLGGVWANSRGFRAALMAPVFLSFLGAAGLAMAREPEIHLGLMGLLGFAYGAIIVAIPVLIRRSAGPAEFGRAFGRVFTAWGLAGLSGPLLGSVLSTHFASYLPAIIAAALASITALLLLVSARDRDAREAA